MKKQFYLFVIATFSLIYTANANVGDTTWVQSFHGDFTHYGAYDTGVVFPSLSGTYRKIYMIVTIGEYNCPSGSQYCHQWDYDLENYVMTPAGDTLELARFITPYATSGTPGFGAGWVQHYIFDVTDYYPILHDSATMQIFYSGYSWGFTGDTKFAFIEGTPERNVLGYTKLWNSTYTYGNPSNPIDSNILPYTITPPAGTQSAEMKFAITGHGYDNATGCCEFDNTGVGHTYSVWANNSRTAQFNMNINCGWSELYPQGGTWLYARAGNWCPGGSLTLAQYKLNGVTAGSPNAVDVSFDDSYNGGGAYGIYKIASSAFYYAAYNKTIDASLEDVIAPTNFEWYRRENPRASVPVVKIRNTGATTITSVLFQYGVADSSMSQYIWTGSLAPSADTIISLPALPALTNLSLGSNAGTYGFIAEIQQVNGQTDNDQSNDTITSHFSVAPHWFSTFIVKMLTSTINANGNLNDGGSPADASWQITDMNNNVVASRTNTNIATAYNDTVTLNAGGFYTLTVSTVQCYGLNWWALAGQTGYTPGSFNVTSLTNLNLTLDGNNVGNGTYHDDFGCGFTQYFTTPGQCTSAVPTITNSGDTLHSSSAYSYQWYYNGSPIQGATDSTYVLTHYGNYTVQVSDSSTGGCNSVSPVYVVPCHSSTPTITRQGNTLVASHGANYQWYNNNTPIPGATDSAYVLTSYGNYSVVVITDTAFGCSNVSAAYNLSCQTATPTITRQGNTLTSSPGFSYQWYNNGISIPGATNSTYVLTQYGNYSVQISDTSLFGCSKISVAYPVPCQSAVPTITNQGGTLISSPGASYQWYSDDTAITGATAMTYAPDSNGSFYVQVVDTSLFGCTKNSAVFNLTNVGLINVKNSLSSVNIAPNPANDAFTMTVNSSLIGNSYIVSDVTGRDILTGTINAQTTLVSVESMTSGVYLVTVSDGVNKTTNRIIVAR